MKIVLFSANAGSPRHGMVFRNYAWAREWVKQGHDVTIVASVFSHSRNVNPPRIKRISDEMIDGIRYIWVWGNVYTQSDTLGRIRSMALYTLQCLFLPLPVKKQADLVIASSPHPFAIFPAWRFARLASARLIYDIRDLWPLTMLKLGKYKPSNPVVWLMQRAENFACRHADLVTAVPHNCEAYLHTKGLPAGRFLAVANGAVIEEGDHTVDLPDMHRDVLKTLRQDNKFIVGYAGSIGVSNAMHVLLDALPGTDARIHVVIMGQGACLDDLMTQAAALNITDRIHVLPPVARPQVQDFLQQIDLAYLGLQDSPLYEMGASLTKLNDYMLAAKPVLYAAGDPHNAVERSGGGFLCQAENSAEVQQALQQAARMSSDDLVQMGAVGRAWLLDHQTAARQTQMILDTLAITPLRAKG